MSIDRIHDTSTIDRATAYHIHRMGRLLRVHLNKMLRENGLDISTEQWFMLFRLYEKSPLAQNELADKELNDHPNITRMIDALEKRKWVQRDPDPDDRRRHLISLTAYGHAQMESVLPAVVATRESLFAGIDASDIEVMLRVFQQMEGNMK